MKKKSIVLCALAMVAVVLTACGQFYHLPPQSLPPTNAWPFCTNGLPFDTNHPPSRITIITATTNAVLIADTNTIFATGGITNYVDELFWNPNWSWTDNGSPTITGAYTNSNGEMVGFDSGTYSLGTTANIGFGNYDAYTSGALFQDWQNPGSYSAGHFVYLSNSVPSITYTTNYP